jgi:hypothetical protein
MRSHMKIYARTQPHATRQRSSDTEEELRRRTRQGWRRERSPNGPPVASHRTPQGPRHHSFDFTATNKPRQTHGHVEEESTTATEATSPTSLDTTIVTTEASTQTSCLPLVPLADVRLQRPSPQEGIRHQGAAIVRSQGSRVSPGAAPSIRSVQEGCGSNATMPPRR